MTNGAGQSNELFSSKYDEMAAQGGIRVGVRMCMATGLVGAMGDDRTVPSRRVSCELTLSQLGQQDWHRQG